MAKKRGGIAGIWDRNKGVIKTLAPAALSFIPGVGIPLAAAAGAAMRGLDRPGQRGIGFNAFEGFKGGVQGAAIGAGTQALAGGVKGLLTAGGRGASSAGAALPAPNMTVGMTPGMTPGITAAVATPAAPSAQGLLTAGGGGSRTGMLSQAAKFAKENKDLIGMAGKGILSALPEPTDEAAMMNAETQRMRLEEERRQLTMEEERRRRIAELLAPMARQYYPQLFGQG